MVTNIFDTLTTDAKLIESNMRLVIPKNKKPAEVYSIVWDLLDRGGKRFRPSLCLLSCQAVGGNRSEALPAATAIELFHNFTLIHDDIEDDSLLRRGKPTLHLIYGTPLAINAGDGLFMMVWESLLESKLAAETTLRTFRILLSAFTGVLEGQAMELNWYRTKNWRISEKDYLKMVGGKTAALIGGACRAGAFIGGGSKAEIDSFARFGSDIGIAFQIQDDVLNLAGDEKKYGKEIGGDITEGKRTLVTIHFLSNARKDDKNWMIRVLNSNTKDRATIRKAIGLLKSHGSIDYATTQAKFYALRAKSHLKKLPKNKSAEKLVALVDFLIERQF